MTKPQDLTRLAASDAISARQASVRHFLRTGEYDLKFPAWSGNVIERETKATDDMLQALVAEVKKLSGKLQSASCLASGMCCSTWIHCTRKHFDESSTKVVSRR